MNMEGLQQVECIFCVTCNKLEAESQKPDIFPIIRKKFWKCEVMMLETKAENFSFQWASCLF